jgi:hypothetical protein
MGWAIVGLLFRIKELEASQAKLADRVKNLEDEVNWLERKVIRHTGRC